MSPSCISSHCRRLESVRSARVSLALVSDLSNYAVYIAIMMHTMDLEVPLLHIRTPIGTNGKKVRYILRLAVKCNQNDTYLKDQAIDAVQA